MQGQYFEKQGTVYLKNVFNKDELNIFKQNFESKKDLCNKAYENSDHLILPIGHNINQDDCINQVLQKLDLPAEKLIGDNWYLTDQGYGPHADAPKGSIGQYLHVVIPIEKSFQEPHTLIVFDQASKIGTLSFTGKLEQTDVAVADENVSKNIDNQHHRFSDCQKTGVARSEYVTNSTNTQIDDDFYQRYCDWVYPKNMFWGLSGAVFPWQPGDVIMFNSSQIHATGRMPEKTTKLGISMLFKLDSSEECDKFKLNSKYNFATI
jgi:hypothetical protein